MNKVKQKYEEPTIALVGNALEIVEVDRSGKMGHCMQKTTEPGDAAYQHTYYAVDVDD